MCAIIENNDHATEKSCEVLLLCLGSLQSSLKGSTTVHGCVNKTFCLIIYCSVDAILAGGSPRCSRAQRNFGEAAECGIVQRYHGGADAAGRCRSWIRRSRPSSCLQRSRQVNAFLLSHKKTKCLGIKEKKQTCFRSRRNLMISTMYWMLRVDAILVWQSGFEYGLQCFSSLLGSITSKMSQ